MNASAQIQREVDALPLDRIDVADPRLYQEDIWPPYFARLRREAPVHYCAESAYGPYWSVTRFRDIMHVEVNHAVYSSAAELGGIQVEEQPKDMDAREDAQLGGRQIRAGDKVVMWYVSGNRDEEAIDDPEGFVIDRPRPRHHLSFGSGIHRCVGDRLAELQLHVLWGEIVKPGLEIEVVGPPVRAYSNFLRGIKSMPVRIAA